MLFSVWFDYVGWLALVLGIQVCWRAGIKVICTWLLVLSIVARACQSFKNGAREWRWPTQAQLARSVFVETSMSWAGSDTGRNCAAISERKVSWHVCISGSSVGQSVSLVLCNCVIPSSIPGGMLAFLAAVCWTSPFSIKIDASHSIQHNYISISIYITHSMTCEICNIKI